MASVNISSAGPVYLRDSKLATAVRASILAPYDTRPSEDIYVCIGAIKALFIDPSVSLKY